MGRIEPGVKKTGKGKVIRAGLSKTNPLGPKNTAVKLLSATGASTGAAAAVRVCGADKLPAGTSSLTPDSVSIDPPPISIT